MRECKKLVEWNKIIILLFRYCVKEWKVMSKTKRQKKLPISYSKLEKEKTAFWMKWNRKHSMMELSNIPFHSFLSLPT